MVQANGRDDELAWVAGEIRRLVQTEGFRYRDISLAICDLAGYALHLQSTCREYEIPLFLDSERPLSGTPLARFVLAVLDIGIYGWTRNATMACLRSGMTSLNPGEIDTLENGLLELGLFRPGRLFSDRLYPGEALLALRDRALLPVRELLDRLRTEPGGNAKCGLLRDFFKRYALPEKIRQRSDELLADGEREAAVALVQSWNELLRILDQMENLIGEPAFRASIVPRFAGCRYGFGQLRCHSHRTRPDRRRFIEARYAAPLQHTIYRRSDGGSTTPVTAAGGAAQGSRPPVALGLAQSPAAQQREGPGVCRCIHGLFVAAAAG